MSDIVDSVFTKIKSKARFSGKEYYDFPWHIHDILYGSALGDGHFQCKTPNSNCNVKLGHSLKQEDYLLWKARELKEHFGGTIHEGQRRGENGKVYKTIRYTSHVHEDLTAFYYDLYKKKDGESAKLNVRLKWLNRMTALGLMVWYFDDGHFHRRHREIRLHTESLNYGGVLKAQKYLSQSWNINSRIERKRDLKGKFSQYILVIRASESPSFLEIILPVIPKECRSMIYKIAIVYKNTKFQQRWISKLIELSPFTEEEIANYYRTQLDDEQFAEVFPNLVTHDR